MTLVDATWVPFGDAKPPKGSHRRQLTVESSLKDVKRRNAKSGVFRVIVGAINNTCKHQQQCLVVVATRFGKYFVVSSVSVSYMLCRIENMSTARSVNKEDIDGMEHQQEQEPDFFSLFGLPSYEDGVNFGSSITSSIRRPMSAILAVVDNALAVLNEEFDSSEDRTMSTSSSSHSDANEQATDIKSCASKIRGCHRRPRRTKTSKMRTIETSASSPSKGKFDFSTMMYCE